VPSEMNGDDQRSSPSRFYRASVMMAGSVANGRIVWRESVKKSWCNLPNKGMHPATQKPGGG